jgi:hypothetical protein
LLAEALHLTDQSFDLGTNVPVKILLGEDRRLGVGDGIDPDEVVIAPARMDLLRAAFAEQPIHVVIPYLGQAFLSNSLLVFWSHPTTDRRLRQLKTTE